MPFLNLFIAAIGLLFFPVGTLFLVRDFGKSFRTGREGASWFAVLSGLVAALYGIVSWLLE